MPTKRLRSRIHQYFTPEALVDLDRICMDRTIGNNNVKADMILNVLNKHGIDHAELGPGTNRMAILIDNFVFKIAFDQQGKRDNVNEFKLSKELQPFVVKTYETNDLISVHEYVTVISREEFIERIDEVRQILAVLAETYLLGDVGAVTKNFLNWGYRDDGKLVILDFAHIYRVNPEQIICRNDQTILDYDVNFYEMVCPKCGKKYKFEDLRRMIPFEQEMQENIIAKEMSFKLTSEVEEFEMASETTTRREEKPSKYFTPKDDVEEEEEMNQGRPGEFNSGREGDAYDNTLELLKSMRRVDTPTINRPAENGNQYQVKVYRNSVEITDKVKLKKLVEEQKQQERKPSHGNQNQGPRHRQQFHVDPEDAYERAMEDLKKISSAKSGKQTEAVPTVVVEHTKTTQISDGNVTVQSTEETKVVAVEEPKKDESSKEVQNESAPVATKNKDGGDEDVTVDETPEEEQAETTEEEDVDSSEPASENEDTEPQENPSEEVQSDEEDEAEKLRRELQALGGLTDEQDDESQNKYEDEYEDLQERADRDRLNNKFNRGGKNQWV